MLGGAAAITLTNTACGSTSTPWEATQPVCGVDGYECNICNVCKEKNKVCGVNGYECNICDVCKEKTPICGVNGYECDTCDTCKEKYKEDPKFKSLDDLATVERMDYRVRPPNSQMLVMDMIRAREKEYGEELGTIRGQYDNLNTPFGEKVRTVQSKIRGVYNSHGGGGPGEMSCEHFLISQPLKDLVSIMSQEFSNPQDAEKFKTKIDLLMKENYLTQRTFIRGNAIDNAERPSSEQNIAELYTKLGIDQGPDAYKELETKLIDMLPESMGPGRYNLVQQLVNYAATWGWMKDASRNGFQVRRNNGSYGHWSMSAINGMNPFDEKHDSLVGAIRNEVPGHIYVHIPTPTMSLLSQFIGTQQQEQQQSVVVK